MVYESSSSAETKKFAERFAKQIANSKSQIVKRKTALVIALEGELGSGKTTFTQGFFRGLGVRRRIVSPTFIIFRRLTLHDSPFAAAYHVDAYRIKKSSELLRLGIKEIFADPHNIALIEWADKIRRILPTGTYWIRFSHGAKKNQRKIALSNKVFVLEHSAMIKV